MNKFRSFLAVAILAAGAATLAHSARPSRDILAWEYIGQVTNSGSQSAQYGNLSNVANAPAGTHFTFYTTATNVAVTVNGPMRIIDRTGKTTIYESVSPGDFSDPESFRSGIPIQVSDLEQQVVVNTTTGSFSVVNTNTVTSVSTHFGDDDSATFGERGRRFLTWLSGQLNTALAGPPSGWFAGYAIK